MATHALDGVHLSCLRYRSQRRLSRVSRMRGGTNFRCLAIAIFLACFVALEVQQANADDLAAIKQRGTLIAGVKVDYPPFGFRSSSGEIEGIEPALAADVARSLGVKLELVPVVASNRVQLLLQGRIDLIIATMNGTLLPRMEVDIVRPHYYAAGYNIMVPKSLDLKSWSELLGKPVCGIQGAYYNYAASMNFEFKITAFANTAEALIALKEGSCAGLLYDDAAIAGYLLKPEWSMYDMPLESQEVQPWGLAVRKDQSAWTTFLSNTVKKWAKDGTILALETKYHIKHSRFAEDAHHEASLSSEN